MTEMPNKTMTSLRMYCDSFPIVINMNNSFSNFEEILTHLIRFELILHSIFILLLVLLCYCFYYSLLF